MIFKARELLIKTCRLGTYLVCHTDAAAQRIDEQLPKRASFMTEEMAYFTNFIFKDDHYSHGVIQFRFDKCKKLCNSFVNEYHDDDIQAMKEYAFALRSLLQYSDYKQIIRELDKNNSPYREIGKYSSYIYALMDDQQQRGVDYDFQLYSMLYTFIINLREVTRYLSKISVAKSNRLEEQFEFEQHLAIVDVLHPLYEPVYNLSVTVKQLQNEYTNEPLQQFLEKQQCTLEQLIDYFYIKILLDEHVQLNDETELLPADSSFYLSYLLNSFYMEPDPENYYIYRLYAINIQEISRFTTITREQLHALFFIHYKAQENAAEWLQQLIDGDETFCTSQMNALKRLFAQFAIAQYTEQSTAVMDRIAKKQIVKVDVKKNVKQSPKTVADHVLRKEIAKLQNEKQLLESRTKAAEEMVSKLEKQLADKTADYFKLQQENEELHALLNSVDDTPAIPEKAKTLVSDIQKLFAQLQKELHVEIEQQPEAERTIFEQIAKLKVAIVGGHQRYHSQLKEKFKQELWTISPDKLNFNDNKLLQYDVIVITTDYTNHSLYEKVFDRLKRANLKHRALTISTQPNAERLAHQIYEFYSQLSE